MNKEELKKALDQDKIQPIYYSLVGLDNPNYNDIIILDKENDLWVVYYYERGQKSHIHTFKTEDEACKFLFGWVTCYPESRIYNPPNE